MRPSTRLIAALISLGLASFAYVTAESLPIGLLSLMAEGLRVSESQVGLLVSVYGLVVVLTSIPLTLVTRHVPRRSLLTALVAIFAAATVASAFAPTYETMIAARTVTALSQALFWSIVVPAAAALAPAEMRGRAIAIVFGGASLADVAGVPVGTWLGELGGWRVAFAALAVVGAATSLALVALLPKDPPAGAVVAHHEPRPRRPYMMLILVTALAATGAFAAFTYVAPFLVDIANFRRSAIGPLLFLRGGAGIAGVVIGGRLADRSAVASTQLAILTQAAALLGMVAIPGSEIAAAAFLALSGLSFSALTASLGMRVVDVAPGNVDLAAAGLSTAVNVGIAAGALIGGLLLPLVGVRAIVLVGATLSIAALLAALAPSGPPLSVCRDDHLEQEGIAR